MAKVVLTSFRAEAPDDKGNLVPQHFYLVAETESGAVTATTDPFTAYPDQAEQTEGSDH